ncbi:MAG: Crp/Fnr family transcriptional regulator [Gammaproteobacteria bacterium]|nr:Crp/Fnr family transcriptional regulator [Gammaproteobacteria bacterium]
MYEPTPAMDAADRQTISPAVRAGADGDAPWPRTALAASHRRTFQSQDLIYHQGGAVQGVYLIRSGMVKLLSYLPHGRARIVRLHVPGDSLGLEGLLGQPYIHTAMATGSVEVECLSMPVLRRLQHEDPGVLMGVLRQWHEYLAQADRWIADFSTGGIKPRLARLLKFLAEVEYGSPADQVKLLSGPEMADILGVTPESISRVLAGFKRSQMLQKCHGLRREIYRVDNGKLQEAACQ